MTGNAVWLVGSGSMSVDYAKVLSALAVPFQAIGRGPTSAAEFRAKTGVMVIEGGLAAFLGTKPPLPYAAIVAVGVEALAGAVKSLLEFGVKRVLVEKPGALHRAEIIALAELARSRDAQVLVGYNRRFYAATLKARDIIAEDGGVKSMSFEFTEWSHVIVELQKSPTEKAALVLTNSTHVIDLAFHLGGTPVEMQAYVAGALNWHPSAAIFAGAGRTDSGALFSYQANWDAPGRWGVEVLTNSHRLIFRPMETLQVMRSRSVKIEPVAIDDEIDRQFKPGLHQQVSRFLAGRVDGFCTLDEQASKWDLYCRIAGYEYQ